MSLDIILLKKCDPIEADRSLRVIEHDGLENIQPSGIITCRFILRIGRNCMNIAWHRAFDADAPPEFFFPDNWESIKKWLKPKFSDGEFFDAPPPSGWDIMYISF